MKRAIVVLSNHRPETICHVAELMCRHEAIFLEEPPDAQFSSMLEGDLSTEEYIMSLDAEYPEFSQGMCHVLRKMHQMGLAIFQVEPYLENLLSIHDFFAQGGSPQDIDKRSVQYEVYLAEKRATSALLDFYRTAAVDSFEKTLESVKRFARMDSRRFLVRDRMRADALVPMLRGYSKAFIEAGQIHYALWRILRRKLGPSVMVTPHFLMDSIVKKLGISRHLYAPGDILTLHYIFHPESNDLVENLLAARALIYSKLILKDEMVADDYSYPHTMDELAVIETVKQLNLKDCAELFALTRRVKTKTARAIVARHLTANRKKTYGLQQNPA